MISVAYRIKCDRLWKRLAVLLPPVNEVCEGYVFTGVCLSTGGMRGRWGGACVVARGACVVVGGMCGCWGVCMVVGSVHVCGCQGGMHGCQGGAWLLGDAWLPGGMRGCQRACVVVGGLHGCQGACMVAGGGPVWLPGVGMCGCGGLHGCQGACMVAGGVLCGCQGWACVVVGGCMVAGGGPVWLPGGMHVIRRDTVNERALCILLECILVKHSFFDPFSRESNDCLISCLSHLF